MLILTRRVSESVVISGKEREDLARILDSGASVKMTILGAKGNQIRIGFEAPPEVAVHREEVYDRIQRGDEHKKKAATA